MSAAGSGGPIVIVGGGIVGVALAFHLAKYGHTDVTVLERGLLGEGATAKATGGIRQQFGSRTNAGLAHAAVDYYARFEELVGEPFEFRQHGYLFLLSREEQYAAFERNVAMQRELGIDVAMVAPADVSDLMPGVVTDDLLGASYCPSDGSGSPADAVAGFVRAARRLGVRLRQHTTVTGIDRNADGAVRAVRTSDGEVPADLVVNAAGPQAAAVAAMVGVDLPVEPHSRQAFGIGPLPQLSAGLPLTVDLATGAYVHPEVHGGIIGGNDRDTPVTAEAQVNWALTESLIAALVGRFPWLADAEIRTGWAGLREMSPDDHGIVGPVPGVPGFWVSAGFSGHGFMQGPVVGDALARRLLGLPVDTDLTPLRFERFAEAAAGVDTGLGEESTLF